MKLISMHADNFGGLHDYDFVFEEGLNIILHDNGWGKTTMAAFLKAMLYGFGSKRSKDITENERKRYKPWQGGTYGGSLDFESEGTHYRIYRTFGETPRFDKVKIINADTNTTARIDPENIGEELFHLDAQAFQRSVFINQNGLSIDGAASSIHTRLNAIVSQANDVAAFDAAIAKLTAQIKIYEKTGNRGRIAEIARQISDLEQQRERLDADIAAQDSARERIAEIDILLTTINEDLENKKKQLDDISGETKRREASKALAEDINKQISQLQVQIDEIKSALGGNIPTPLQVDEAKRHSQAIKELSTRLQELASSYTKLTDEYKVNLERFHGTLPTKEQLDDLQSVYGELQGVLSTDAEETASDDELPPGYELIHAALDANEDYIGQLKVAIDAQETLLQLIRKLESLEREISQETETWTKKQQRFSELVADVKAYQEAVDEKKQYTPEAVDSVITGLEELQKSTGEIERQRVQHQATVAQLSATWEEKKKQFVALKEEIASAESRISTLVDYSSETITPIIKQLENIQKSCQTITAKQDSLSGFELTGEEEALLAEIPGQIPEAVEGDKILKQHRKMIAHQAELQGLSAKLDGEQCKADSLRSSLDQLESVAFDHIRSVAAPKKSVGGAMIGIGIAVAIVAVLLGVVLMPVLMALAVVGVVPVVLGLVDINRYKTRVRDYEVMRTEEAKKEENDKKKVQLHHQLNAVKESISNLKKEIANCENQMESLRRDVAAWMEKWAGSAEVSETEICKIIDRWEDLRKLRKKGQYIAETQDYIQKQIELISEQRKIVDAQFPSVGGIAVEEALRILHKGETEYKIEAEKLATAKRKLAKIMADANISERWPDEAPGIAEIRQQLQCLDAKTESIEATRKSFDAQYPKITGLSYEATLAFLRGKLSEHQVSSTRLRSAILAEQRFMGEAKVTAEQLANAQSPNFAQLDKERDAVVASLEQALANANGTLCAIGLHLTAENIQEELRKADQLLNVYQRYAQKLADKTERVIKKQYQIDQLQEKLAAKLSVLQGCYADAEVPKRLSLVRENLTEIERLCEKISVAEAEQRKLKEKLDEESEALNAFLAEHRCAEEDSEDVLTEIYAKVYSHTELLTAIQQLEKQRTSIGEDQPVEEHQTSADENELKAWIANAETRRDNLLIEYTQKSDFIRQTDQSLEKYSEVETQIRQLYEQKQKDQNTLVMLKRTVRLITQAKENLANRYLSRVEQLFNNYLQIWLSNDVVRGILDIDFNVTIEENGQAHMAEGYSTGYCDLIDLCMRLALVDTLFESEQPFLILDDPFVNLDAVRLEKVLELLNVMAVNKQIVYFICHPIRAVDVDQASESREAFVRLAEATRKTIEGRKTNTKDCGKSIRKSPRELYKIVNNGRHVAIKPAKLNYTITNNIFGMNFVVDDAGALGSCSYELFFIDAQGRVLNERQLLEIKDGKLSVQRIQFCLNSRDDSGTQYELMIRESTQDDYEVVSRIPFEVKLSFTGTDCFDF